jgi:hypothetical protein
VVGNTGENPSARSGARGDDAARLEYRLNEVWSPELPGEQADEAAAVADADAGAGTEGARADSVRARDLLAVSC